MKINFTGSECFVTHLQTNYSDSEFRQRLSEACLLSTGTAKGPPVEDCLFNSEFVFFLWALLANPTMRMLQEREFF